MVSTYDQNVQVHLPQSISTHVERHTIQMLCDLLSLDGFNGTITTGATAGNILGIACGREATVHNLLRKRPSETGEGKVLVLTAGAHSSISKASSILGVGRDNVISMSHPEYPASCPLNTLEITLQRCKLDQLGPIVVATFGEVNTGGFTNDIKRVHELCQRYSAWFHIDAAFGIMARIHPDMQSLTEGLELADSISFDGHKFFNVPYDCGVYLTRDMATLSSVCGNQGAAYLSGGNDYSPLNISLENSRRFRALPLYASLISLGKQGYIDIVSRCCNLAKAIGRKIVESREFKLLYEVQFNIVLFQVIGWEEKSRNEKVKDLINGTGKVYVSGTEWHGMGALRIAICNYLTRSNAEEEAAEIIVILHEAIALAS
jgi:glutamate/tyrosine decarboxylase-like PLP-dependent enzyme